MTEIVMLASFVGGMLCVLYAMHRFIQAVISGIDDLDGEDWTK